MERQNRSSREVRERAVRMLSGHRAEYEWEWEWEWAALCSIAEKIECSPGTRRTCARRVQIDRGDKPGMTTEERERMKQLERELKELHRGRDAPLDRPERSGCEIPERRARLGRPDRGRSRSSSGRIAVQHCDADPSRQLMQRVSPAR